MRKISLILTMLQFKSSQSSSCSTLAPSKLWACPQSIAEVILNRHVGITVERTSRVSLPFIIDVACAFWCKIFTASSCWTLSWWSAVIVFVCVVGVCGWVRALSFSDGLVVNISRILSRASNSLTETITTNSSAIAFPAICAAWLPALSRRIPRIFCSTCNDVAFTLTIF